MQNGKKKRSILMTSMFLSVMVSVVMLQKVMIQDVEDEVDVVVDLEMELL